MLLAVLIVVASVLAAVSVHLATLIFLTKTFGPRLPRHTHLKVGLMVFAAVIAHLIEILIFAAGLTLIILLDIDEASKLEWSQFDVFFHSAATYTSLGNPTPSLRSVQIFTAIEAVTGLILITWTASLLFLAMQRWWEKTHNTS